MTFQRAPPEVNGFGVSTSTPGLTRSSQPLMFFGLPGRTASATTERVTIPFVGVAFQSAGDELLLDELRDVGLERERRDVRRQAGDDGARLVAGVAVGLRERHARALRRLARRPG